MPQDTFGDNSTLLHIMLATVRQQAIAWASLTNARFTPNSRGTWDWHAIKSWPNSGVGRQGRMFLLCYSSEGHKLLLDTRNNSGLLAIVIHKLHDRFYPSKTVVELVNFTCEWPNSQLDPTSVASLCRLVVVHSVGSYDDRHGRK